MSIKTSLPVFWLPLIAFWTFLIVIQSNLDISSGEDIVPLLVYLIVSFLLVLQLNLLIVSKKESFLVKFGTTNILFCSLSFATIAIILKFLTLLSNEWAIGLTILPLISNTIIAELLSYSNKYASRKKNAWVKTNQLLEVKQLEKSKEDSEQWDLQVQNRNQWKIFLEQASLDYLSSPEIIQEISRIQDILEYSSFFRSEESLNILSNLRENPEITHMLVILRRIK